ncbi:hypothetical protein BDN67DRAFT_1073026, partial [Paxillus ammoniavirescens]
PAINTRSSSSGPIPFPSPSFSSKRKVSFSPPTAHPVRTTHHTYIAHTYTSNHGCSSLRDTDPRRSSLTRSNGCHSPPKRHPQRPCPRKPHLRRHGCVGGCREGQGGGRGSTSRGRGSARKGRGNAGRGRGGSRGGRGGRATGG